jgi:hypothetical protein
LLTHKLVFFGFYRGQVQHFPRPVCHFETAATCRVLMSRRLRRTRRRTLLTQPAARSFIFFV